MNRFTASVGAVLLAVEAVMASQPLPGRAPSQPQALVDKYCAGCHNDRRTSGGFSWTSLDLSNLDGVREQYESGKAD